MSDSNSLIQNAKDEIYIAEKGFLSRLVNERINIFLTNGVRIECELIEYDDVCLLVTQKKSSKRDMTQLIYKESIATIQET